MSGPASHPPAARRALAAIPGFAGAVISAQLSDGPTNASFLVEHDDARYVLRLDKPEAAVLGLDRGNEKQICGVVAAAGLAPEPVRFDVEAGLYLRHYLEGRSWTRSSLARPGRLRRLAGVLRKLHGLPPVGASFEPLAAARRYALQLGTPAARALAEKAEQLAGAAGSDAETPACLCHNDLVCQNVLESNRLYLIDWEYAGLGDPFSCSVPRGRRKPGDCGGSAASMPACLSCGA
jgi:thiamine kinase-like enzyme